MHQKFAAGMNIQFSVSCDNLRKEEKEMKKLISLLAAVCMTASMIPSAMALVSDAGSTATLDDWYTDSHNTLTVAQEEINGVTKNVVTLNPDCSAYAYTKDALEAGNYQVSFWVKTDGEIPRFNYGLRDSDGGEKARPYIDDYSQLTWAYFSETIALEATMDVPTFNIKIEDRDSYSTDAKVYMAGVSIRKINDDGSLSANLIKNPDCKGTGAATVDENAAVDGVALEDGSRTVGISGVITPNESNVSSLTFTFSNGTNTLDKTFDFAAVSGSAAVTYGINVYDVPAGATVSVTEIVINN